MKISIVAVNSVNGLISRDSDYDVDWSSPDDRKFFKKITTSAGVVIFGRRTFETIGKPLPKRLNVILTRTPERFHSTENLLFTNDEPEILISKIGRLGFKHIVIGGGREIYTLFLKNKLVTDIYLSIEPIILKGKVTMLNVEELNNDIRLELEELLKLSKNTLVVHYTIPENRVRELFSP
ncbi:dihydrofolate reductase family protein [Kosmotoga sp.]|uniref:dihydrofolate reductase family protein n=1 Tax=Kosmotoga sp. TaxID=1955248 RepID=UPI0024AB08B9|nr:dihydrofolate reductase family protein [Kosmotoga sp.]MDI3524069.1 dihydrofolate reductase [Kosmotoga sp.]MDK2953488.1 dihydrofolate reductase [Kosmotoga sp.]